MTEWPESRQLASQYHSPSPTGIGFAQYASTGTVTPELWENIKHIEGEAERRPDDPAVEGWAGDMVHLRALLAAEGITEKRLEVTETSDEQVTIEFDGLTIQLWRSSLEKDRGQPVVQIDGSGMLRVNVNDYPIWNADPDNHEHHECLCVTDFELRDEVD